MEINKEQKQITSNSLISTPAPVLQRRIALVIGGLLVLVVLLAIPFAHQMLPHFPLFIAFYCSLALFADLITAYLLFGQFFRTRSPSLLALATTYFFSGLIILPYVLSFPGLFSATGLLHAGTQTANWLWIFWHTGFSLGILFSVLLDKKQGGSRVTSRQLYRQFILVLVLLPLLILLLSIVAITSDSFLPILIVNGDLTGMITTGVGPAILLIAACACIASLLRIRRGTVMDVWLIVATLASLLDVALVLWAGSRYSVGWYLARVNTIITATVVLCVLLYQVNRLYEQIVDQVEELFSLKEANRVRDQFFATMSHELRTPLTSIIGFSEMLLEEVATAGFDELQQNDLERIHKNGQHLLSLINDVLDLSKIEAGRMAVPYSQVDVRKLLISVVEETQSIAIKQHLGLRAEVEEGIDFLESNPMKLHQILLNLVSNALKFTKQGQVTISAKRVKAPGKQVEQVAIAVKDSGMGIPADIQEHIFEAFYQADGSYTRKFGGTGLGLSIVRQLTTLLGGTIAVTSAPGEGSTFTLLLPNKVVDQYVVQGPPSLHPMQQEAHELAPAMLLESVAKTATGETNGGQNNVVLALDDNQDAIALIEAALKGTPYKVFGLTDSSKVMESIQALQPCAITLDVMMPRFNGWQVLHQLKDNPAVASIPVVMLTVLSEPTTGYVLGANDYVIKPFKKEALVSTLDRLVTSSRHSSHTETREIQPI